MHWDAMSRIGQHPLPVAQYLRLREQIPALYGLLSVNAAILGYTHRHLAPTSLAVVTPAVLIGICLCRMIMWMRPVSERDLDLVNVQKVMRRTVQLALVLAFAYVGWAIALDRYGGPYEHGHVAIFIAVTVLGCIFCLTFLPIAAVLVASSVLGTFLLYSLLQGTEILVAIALNIALVTAVVLKTLRDYFTSFVSLEKTQRDLHLERRQAQALSEENAVLAQTDALTGLPNRRFFFASLEGLLEHARPGDVFTVGLIDLDKFKPINDTHGHAHGDRLLQVIGQRIIAHCPPDTIVARLGGDEFGLIVMGGPDDAERITRSLFGKIREAVRIGDILVSVGCSAGLGVYPAAGTSAHLLFDRADFALYHAKREKRGQCVRFTEELESLIRSEQAIDAALQGADLSSELTILFQPIVSADSLQTQAVECLARWTSPRLGSVSPELLIASSERVGLARDVTLVLFGHVLVALSKLPRPVRVTFNLSGHNLCDVETITAILEMMEASGCDPSRLILEITETSLIADVESAGLALTRLRETGAAVALDDFGTGYSSLSALHTLPLDIVKIDRSFAARLDEVSGRRFVTAIRNLARSLSLECIIEGIETENQLLRARLAGFTLIQGFYVARPMPLPDLLASFCSHLSLAPPENDVRQSDPLRVP
jgi:diguanylate cyclase (GGDEF) domain